jgi:hypothetical protein
MEVPMYKCNFCGIYYTPKRRFVQRFCSDSCRSLNHIKNKNQKEISKPINDDKTNPVQIDKMSWSGVGNNIAGTLAVNFATSLLTKEENKPATKKDTNEIKNLLSLQRHPIKNHPNRFDGARPFYDIQTQSIIYLK